MDEISSCTGNDKQCKTKEISFLLLFLKIYGPSTFTKQSGSLKEYCGNIRKFYFKKEKSVSLNSDDALFPCSNSTQSFQESFCNLAFFLLTGRF